MNKQIAILRGINVGGRRKILMKDLKALFNHLGFVKVQTYIQSGNVIFNSSGETNNLRIAAEIEKSILKEYDFQVPVIVLTALELQNAISENPFSGKNIELEKLHLTFLKEVPKDDRLQNIQTFNFAPDKFEIKNKNTFICCSGKYSQSKLTNSFFESKLKVLATTRNWKTILKLSEMVSS